MQAYREQGFPMTIVRPSHTYDKFIPIAVGDYRHSARPLTNAGLCYLRLKDDAAAEVQFLRAVQADPANGQALYQLADIAYRSGRYDQARSHLIRLHQQLNPSAASVWLGLRAERRLGNHDAEASYASQLESRFVESEEFKLFNQGKFE